MYGWRARIGLLIPANNTVIEPEFWSVVPTGVSVHSTRMVIEGPFTREALDRMARRALAGVEELRQSQVNVIGYACLSTSLAKGAGWDAAFGQEMAVAGGVQAFTAASAVAEGMRAVGIRFPAVISPYPAAIAPLVEPFFRASGFMPVTHRSLSIEDYQAVVRLMPYQVYEFAQTLDLDGADGVCILATDLRTLEVIDALETDLGLPVVTTNQAILWQTLRQVGISASIDRLGRLLKGKGDSADG